MWWIVVFGNLFPFQFLVIGLNISACYWFTSCIRWQSLISNQHCQFKPPTSSHPFAGFDLCLWLWWVTVVGNPFERHRGHSFGGAPETRTHTICVSKDWCQSYHSMIQTLIIHVVHGGISKPLSCTVWSCLDDVRLDKVGDSTRESSYYITCAMLQRDSCTNKTHFDATIQYAVGTFLLLSTPELGEVNRIDTPLLIWEVFIHALPAKHHDFPTLARILPWWFPQ